jgi:hypothetical protein
MRPIGERERLALMLEVHRAIEESAASAAASLAAGKSGELAYPPNGGVGPEEAGALSRIIGTPELESAFRKVIADASANALFHLLCVVDGVATPEVDPLPWSCYTIAEAGADAPMLHDELFESYWEWRSRRTAAWRLDTCQDSGSKD